MAERAASSNIYTVLSLIALVAIICAIVFVWMRSSDLFGGGNPFQPVPVPVVHSFLGALGLA